jgi:hypothetical protein
MAPAIVVSQTNHFVSLLINFVFQQPEPNIQLSQKGKKNLNTTASSCQT